MPLVRPSPFQKKPKPQLGVKKDVVKQPQKPENMVTSEYIRKLLSQKEETK